MTWMVNFFSCIMTWKNKKLDHLTEVVKYAQDWSNHVNTYLYCIRQILLDQLFPFPHMLYLKTNIIETLAYWESSFIRLL